MKRLFLMFLSMITAGTIMLSMTVYAEEASCDADQILEVLAENTSLKRVDEWQIKPAEFNEDGTLPYVSLLHLQELDGILIRCIDETALNNIAGNRLVYPLEDFISIHDQIEKVDGREKNTERDNLAEYFGDNYYVVEMCFGVFPAESKQRLIVESIIDNPQIELVGILRTDWYVKGFYDDMNTGLYIVPADDSVLQPDALDSEEYCNLDYKSQLSEYQLSYIRDLPQNTGFATVKLDGRTYEEIVELCNKLESRPDISYAWIAPVYLEDMLTNDGDYSYSLYLFSSDLQPDVTTETREADMTYTETTTTTTAEPNQEYDYEGAFRVSSYPWFNWVGEELDFSEMKLELLVMNSDGKFSATVLPFSFTVQSGLYSDYYTIDTSAVDSTKEGNNVVNVSTKAGEIITVSKDKDYRIKLTDYVSPFTAQYHEKQTLLHFSNGSGENDQVNCLLNETCTVSLNNVNGSEIISCAVSDSSIAEIVEVNDRKDFCNYKIQGLQLGETVITAETADGRTASCVIHVVPFEEMFPDTTTDSTTVVSTSETTTTALSSETETSTTIADLPQTGNNSLRILMLVLSASGLIGFGMLAVVQSGVIRRREEEQ